MKRGGDGKFYRAFTCIEGVRNEALDGRVGTMAIERIVKPNYAKLGETLKETQLLEKQIAGPGQPISDQRPENRPFTRKTQGGFVRKLRRPGSGFVHGW